MTTDDQVPQDEKRLEAALQALSEHFDAVQIFATITDPDGTRTHEVGSGNWYARYGHVKEWVVKQEAVARFRILKDLEE